MVNFIIILKSLYDKQNFQSKGEDDVWFLLC